MRIKLTDVLELTHEIIFLKKIELAADFKNEAQPTPGLQVEDTEDYYIVPFRLLSATIVTGLGYPVDYLPNALKNKVEMFNRTLYKNHDWTVDNWIGLVRDAVFNETTTPQGVDARLYFDKKLPGNDRIIRGVQTNALTRCSVTLTTRWKQSHEKMNRDEFIDKLGTIVDNELVRVIVTDILEVYEVSLVWWGADDTAKKTSQQLTNDIKINPGVTKTPDKEVNLDFEKLKKLLSQSLGIELKTDEEIWAAVQSLAAKNQELTARVQELLPALEFKNTVTTAARNRVLSLAKVVHGDRLKQEMIDLYNAADYDKLQVYEADLEKEFPLTCPKCQTSMSRRSSIETSPFAFQKKDKVEKRIPV